MSSLFPSDWNNFVHRMAADKDLFEMYIKFFYKSYENHEMDTREDILCRFVTGRSDDPQLCKEILKEFRKAEERRGRRLGIDGILHGEGGGKMRGKPIAKVVDLC